ncbi:hypothetical protein FKM82_000746 [Ascaphus truei]
MPIFKLPVVQQFGIISTRYHQDFQKRLLEKTLKNEDPERKNVDHRRPLEITEEFIKQFNNADEIEEQSRMLDIARKILHRCKHTMCPLQLAILGNDMQKETQCHFLNQKREISQLPKTY